MSGLVTWQSGDKVPLIIHSTSKAKKTTYHHWRARPTKNVHVMCTPTFCPSTSILTYLNTLYAAWPDFG
eukprot:scaffold63699_cov24-Tisochrysis_lutea.AAC.1